MADHAEMNKDITDPDAPLGEEFVPRGIIEPSIELGLKAGFAGLAVGAFSSRYFWPHTFAHLPRISALAASYGAMGASFGTVRGLSEELRKVDTPLNWFNGGIAAGTVNGLRLRNTAYGISSAVAFGLSLALLKGYNTSFNVSQDARYITAAEKDKRRMQQWRNRKFEDTIKLDVFGERSDEVRAQIREQVQNRQGVFARLPQNE